METMTGIITSLIWMVALISLKESFNSHASAQSVDVTILDPETLSDADGNTADKNSNITFADIADNRTYKSHENPEDDFGPIRPLYDLSGSLVRSALPGGFPFEWISKVKDGKIDIGNDWKKIAVDYLGYIIALAVGVVFFVVFPIVGLCFCCCRCCGNCGGRRVIKAATEAGHGDKCGRLTALSLLSVFKIMALVGSILMLVTNFNLSTSIKSFCNNDIDKLDDVDGFLNTTVQQAERLVQGNFNFTLAVVFRDLDNIGHLLGVPVRDGVLRDTGLGVTYTQIDNLESDAKTMDKNLKIVNDSKAVVVEKAELFHNFTVSMSKTLEDMAKNDSNFNTRVANRTITTKFDASQLPDETYKLMALDGFVKQGISSLTAESKKNLNEIPEKVQNETLNQRADLKKEVHSYEDEITKVIDNLKSMRTDVMKGVDVDKMKGNLKDYTDKLLQYDQYRWYGGLGIAGVLMVVVLLSLLGISFGFFGGNSAVDPAERSGLSNAGGNMLVAAVVLTFIFAWLTMILTTVLFAVGAPVDKFACGALRDLSTVDKLLDDYNILGGGGKNKSWLGSKIFAGKNVSLQLSDLMESCKNSETAYSALKMEEANIFNLSEVTDYKKKFNVDGKIDGSIITFEDINITTGPMMQFIDFMKTFDMNYTAYNETFIIDPVEPSKQLLTKLYDFKANQNPTGNLKADLDNAITEFEKNINSSGETLLNHSKMIQDAVERIRQTTKEPTHNTLRDKCDRLQQSLHNIEQNLSTIAREVFNVSVKAFETRLTHILDTFIADLENAVKNKIGVCRPLWNLYNDVAVQGICHSLVGTLNTWWCAMGWTSFFLVTSICAAVKLSKHFRRMTYSDNKSHNKSSEKSPKNKHHFKNKIAHSDSPNGLEKF
ncbi:hypothetical protein BsWGS_00673 [Bradybaena similaris]